MTIAERNNKLKHFITCLKCEVSCKCCDDNCSTQYDAGNMGEIIENLEAISKALDQEPFINKPCVSEKVCEHDKNEVLDKIRAEIESYKLSEDELSDMDEDSVKWGMKIAYDLVNKYKTETEG